MDRAGDISVIGSFASAVTFGADLNQPANKLFAERFPVTLREIGFGLLVGWLLGVGLAIAVVVLRAWPPALLAGGISATLLSIPAPAHGRGQCHKGCEYSGLPWLDRSPRPASRSRSLPGARHRSRAGILLLQRAGAWG